MSHTAGSRDIGFSTQDPVLSRTRRKLSQALKDARQGVTSAEMQASDESSDEDDVEYAVAMVGQTERVDQSVQCSGTDKGAAATSGARCGARTHDPEIKSLMLCRPRQRAEILRFLLKRSLVLSSQLETSSTMRLRNLSDREHG